MQNNELIESLSPDERKIIPHLSQKTLSAIIKESGLDETRILRALQFLSNKGIVSLKSKEKKIIDLGDNGFLYKKNGLPERRLLNFLAEKKFSSLDEVKKEVKLSDNELKASIGALKKKAMLDLKEGKLILTASMDEIIKKSLDEQLLDALPLALDSLTPEQKHALENLKSRKDIIKINKEKEVSIEVTNLGKEIMSQDISKCEDMLEALTSEIIQKGSWKGKKFRRYDLVSPVPKIYGGKKHFVNQATEYAKKIWLEMGFKEMSGNMITTSFWNFDVLFTAQDHPVRELQDTFFIKDIKAKLPDAKLVKEIKKAHEGGVDGSKGWQYKWEKDDAKKILLRTHTTCLSAQTLRKIAENKELPAKYFALGKCFRNETIDWNHGFEFNQTEGIVIDENANFRQLMGYLKEFFRKMGYEEIRIRPSYFPYTEPSLEIDVYDKKRNKWIELGGAGMFRPEVTIPFFGRHIPILAWGPGFDRIIREFFKIEDLREFYKNDLTKSRELRFWSR